jgi:hypothetical protein
MRRLARWLGAALGGLALYRLVARRRRRAEAVLPVDAPPVAADAETRAEELRRKLQESRALEDERAAFEEGETTVDQADPDESVDRRRREVHESARAAADEMHSSGGTES